MTVSVLGVGWTGDDGDVVVKKAAAHVRWRDAYISELTRAMKLDVTGGRFPIS